MQKNRDSDRLFGKTVAVPVIILLVFWAVSVSTASTIAERHSSKIRKIAAFMASELSNKGIKTVAVRPFTDPVGKETDEGRAVTEKFLRHLSSFRKKVSVRPFGDADAIITGTFMPYKEGGKWQLNIKAVWTGSDRTVTSYSAVFK